MIIEPRASQILEQQVLEKIDGLTLKDAKACIYTFASIDSILWMTIDFEVEMQAPAIENVEQQKLLYRMLRCKFRPPQFKLLLGLTLCRNHSDLYSTQGSDNYG